MSHASEEILVRLTPDEIITRAEKRQERWMAWAVFWFGIGTIVGAAVVLILAILYPAILPQ